MYKNKKGGIVGIIITIIILIIIVSLALTINSISVKYCSGNVEISILSESE